MWTQVDGWARTEATVDVFERNKACLMDLTTAWLYGLGNGTDFLGDCTAAKAVLGAFKEQAAAFFWRSEFWGTSKLMQWIDVHLVPQAAHRSQHLINEWNSAMCKRAFSCVTQQSLTRELVESTVVRPLIYTQLRRSLKYSNLPLEELEATLSTELLDHLLASHDATGITLTYLMHQLSHRRTLQRALREELRHCTPAGLAHLFQGDLDTLPLLDAVLMETLRLHSANPGPWPRRVPGKGCRVGPFDSIPGKTVVSASSYTLHRNAAIFPHPEEWRTERWLEATKEELTEMNRWFWAFGSGARMCIGRYFAVHSKLSSC